MDRISELPDSILGHILSFLPTKNAVATHILSKRWNFVWTTVTNLDFRYPDHCNEDREYDFVDFVNCVLLLHKPAYLNRLSLTLETDYVLSIVEARINYWIRATFAMNVHELFVSAKNFKLPIQTLRILFSCETLQSLELNCTFCISSEMTISLPRLECLRLSSIYFQGEEALPKLLGGCPELKYLFIDFYVDNLNIFPFRVIISSTSLRHLELYLRICPTKRVFCFIELNAPSLEYIKLEDHEVSFIQNQQRLNSLVEANIQVLVSFDFLNQIPNGFDYVVKDFQAFNCAKALTLSAQVIRALSRAIDKMRTKFKRLTRLEVTIDRNHWSSLQDLIKLSDCLEVLTIKKDRDTSENYLNNSNWMQPDLVPGCLSNSLRTVSIGNYCGHHDELGMVSYILKHGSVLQDMKICFDESVSDLKAKFEMVKKISKFPTKSLVCEVEFC